MKNSIHLSKPVNYDVCDSCEEVEYGYIVKTPNKRRAHFCDKCVEDIIEPRYWVYRIINNGKNYWTDAVLILDKR